jgi:SPP1 family phage portal protein
MFRLPKGTEIDIQTLDYFLGLHKQAVTARYKPLLDAYEGRHEIFDYNIHPKKAAWKPDNRIAVNFPKYITDTFNGFFIGNPVKITTDDEAVAEYVEFLSRYNDQDNHDAELSKICSIYGKGYEMCYTDDEGEPCFIRLSPIDAFMIYDDSILERPMYFVRVYKDWKDNEYGSISNAFGVRHFRITDGTKWTDDDWVPHQFCDVPATEYVENDERQGIFETELPSINSYNKALSEKANDVDYFADAYLKVLGAELKEDGIQGIRNNRIINIYGEYGDPQSIVAEFMERPSNDAGQENLLNRLERLIFQTAMVANISDEHFGTASGIALEYKVLAMHNLVKMKSRKMESGMNRRYKLLFSHPTSKAPADAWVSLRYKVTPNLPANRLEEAQIAAAMEGITSHATQLEVLSVVDNVQDELDRIEEENEPPAITPVEQAMFAPTPPVQDDDTDTEEEPTEDDEE